jgi:hypothetical protein
MNYAPANITAVPQTTSPESHDSINSRTRAVKVPSCGSDLRMACINGLFDVARPVVTPCRHDALDVLLSIGVAFINIRRGPCTLWFY